MTITEHARRYLISEGLRPETVIKVGSSMKEVLEKNSTSIENSKILENLNLEKGEYFVDKWTKIDKNLIFNYVK